MLSAKRSEFLSGQAFHFSIAEERRKNKVFCVLAHIWLYGRVVGKMGRRELRLEPDF
jgi:hypothetical protein